MRQSDIASVLERMLYAGFVNGELCGANVLQREDSNGPPNRRTHVRASPMRKQAHWCSRDVIHC
jgi:hypothetical protein